MCTCKEATHTRDLVCTSGIMYACDWCGFLDVDKVYVSASGAHEFHYAHRSECTFECTFSPAHVVLRIYLHFYPCVCVCVCMC